MVNNLTLSSRILLQLLSICDRWCLYLLHLLSYFPSTYRSKSKNVSPDESWHLIDYTLNQKDYPLDLRTTFECTNYIPLSLSNSYFLSKEKMMKIILKELPYLCASLVRVRKEPVVSFVESWGSGYLMLFVTFIREEILKSLFF